MTKPLTVQFPQGAELYLIRFRDSDGAWWDVSGGRYEAPLTSAWADYAVSMTEYGDSGLYSAADPDASGAPGGYLVFSNEDGTPGNEASTDPLVRAAGTGSVMATISAPEPGRDAFGRFRVSAPATIFDSKQTLDAQPLLWDDQGVSGAGTGSSHSVAQASSTLSVSEATAGVRVRQTFRRFNYLPGKSQLILMTGVLDKSGGGAGITRQMGLFDDANGIFLEDAAGAVGLVVRSSTSGSPVDDRVEQASWNLDPMDGTGPSGITLDWTKAQILVVDFEWLGVGRVRVGFNVDGDTVYVHEFLHANLITGVYMSTPNLPLRFRVENDGTGAASTLEAICCSVQSEGGAEPQGITRSASSNGTHVDAATENTVYALLGIRLGAGYLGATVEILRASVQLQTASHKAEWLLLWNPTVDGSFSYVAETSSVVEIARGAAANTVTGGVLIAGGYVESGGPATGGSGSAREELSNALRLGASIAGVADRVVLAIRPIAGSTSVDAEGMLTWREQV